MTAADFTESVDVALQHCGMIFDRQALGQFIRDRWPLILKYPEPSRWAAEFMLANGSKAGQTANMGNAPTPVTNR